jgi:1-acyl-sn-glycerol-3-phosphate acyltransferase
MDSPAASNHRGINPLLQFLTHHCRSGFTPRWIGPPVWRLRVCLAGHSRFSHARLVFPTNLVPPIVQQPRPEITPVYQAPVVPSPVAAPAWLATARSGVACIVRLICGVPRLPPDALPASPCIFFANHSSHLDFVVIWSALPAALRRRTRPVAGRDYWTAGALRRWIGGTFFAAVLIERQKVTVSTNPLQPMLQVLDAGGSLIVFPEGTRSRDGSLGEFKGGLYHLARERPAVPLVPVALENLNRILPKGEGLPVPVIARIATGAPVALLPGETKAAFLTRARAAVASLQAH